MSSSFLIRYHMTDDNLRSRLGRERTVMEPDTVQKRDPHLSLHSEVGPRRGEHPGRARNPVVKVSGLAWLEFEKPDLARTDGFLVDFGFTAVDRTPEMLLLRGRWAGTAGLV